MFRTKVAPADGVAIAVVILVAVLLFWNPFGADAAGETLVVTTPEGSTEYSLLENREISVTSDGITLVIVIDGGEAFVRESGCPDGVCVAGGRISKSGEVVLCAPAGVTLTVKGGSDDVDFVAG